MYKHSTNSIVMVRPIAFKYNAETAVNNIYQNNDDTDVNIVQEQALEEFDNMVKALRDKGVNVNVLQDNLDPPTPDSIFPNNWFSTHEGGTLVIYPMFAENRQEEIFKFKDEVMNISFENSKDSEFFTVIDYHRNRDKNQILEGTGSMVIDRKNKVAYCALSARADEELFVKFCQDTGHEPVFFQAKQDGEVIYHTNILMGIGQKNTLICLDSIEEAKRDLVIKKLEEGGNNIIDLSFEQIKAGAGNTLELVDKDGKNFIVMSLNAYNSLTDDQIKEIEKSTEILAVDINTIEYYGGGSARCMMAEIFE